MFLAHLGKEVSGWASSSSSYVFMAPPDTFNGFLEILAFPFEISSQNLVECDGGVLATAPSVFLKLRLAFRFEGNRVHDRLL
jgi:hypothetical protein